MAENRILYTSRLMTVGLFRCPPDNPRWHGVNINGDEPLAAFPATSVVIHQLGREPVLANPNHVMFYGAGARYRRRLHDARGDQCLFASLGPELADELLEGIGLVDKAIPFSHGPSDPGAYLQLKLVADRLAASTAESLQVEEAVNDAIARSLERGALLHVKRRRPPRDRTEHDHHRLVEDAKALLTERVANHDSLDMLARTLHTSAFHLGRIFRDRTGSTMHAYRTQLRLRLALDRLADPDADLRTIALELGFNSHSHFTGAFRSVFSVAPSELRAASERGRRRELLRTVDASLAGRS